MKRLPHARHTNSKTPSTAGHTLDSGQETVREASGQHTLSSRACASSAMFSVAMTLTRSSASRTCSCAERSQTRIQETFGGCEQDVRSSKPAALSTSAARDAEMPRK